MPVKHWSFAGLMLSYRCDARCASCYVGCGPERRGWARPESVLAAWRGLIDASPHGCRVHLTGGEPFGNWPLLIELAGRAREEGLAPLEKVETHAGWAVDDGIVRERVAALADAGMEKLSVSCDPYHQQFVPIRRVRRAVRVAEEQLGADRVQVRWRDWLRNGFDTDDLTPEHRTSLFREYALRGRDRMNGRAADVLGPAVARKTPGSLADMCCREPLLRGRHVHVDPDGRVTPGVCAGIVIGRIGPETPGELWRRLDADWAERPLLSTLAIRGPVGLMDEATRHGYEPAARYASKCHLCWDVRRFLARRGLHAGELGPAELYEPAPAPDAPAGSART